MKVHPISRKELWAAQLTLAVAILLQGVIWALNPELSYGPHNLIIVTEIVLAVLISFLAGKRHVGSRHLYRFVSAVFLGLISLANIISLFLVGRLLIFSDGGLSGRELLVAALAIFLTNIIVFALWYWEIDSPGLTGKKWSKHDKDFQFIQQDMVGEFPNWQPEFPDYLFLSTINAFNGATTSAHPLTHQAKFLMATQALVSVLTLVLVLARSISILG
jgi:hypothetical protein